MSYRIVTYCKQKYTELATAIEGDITSNSWTPVSVSMAAYNGLFYATVIYSYTPTPEE